MALEKTLDINYASGLNTTVVKAYIRIGPYTGDKNSTTIYVDKYLSKAAYEEGKQSIEPTEIHSFEHDTSDTAPNVVKQGYEYLKTLLKYVDATDC